MPTLRKIRSALDCSTRAIAQALDISDARVSSYVSGSRKEKLTAAEIFRLRNFVEAKLSAAQQALVLVDEIEETNNARIVNSKKYNDSAHRLNYKPEPSVYVIRQFDRAKVGFTVRPADRLKEYKLHHHEANYAFLRQGNRGDEMLLHKLLQEFHIGGEWYNYNPQMQKILDEYDNVI